ncbi:MAG: acetyltransferase [Labilithrix sp.]|nr:acetyltransferase [Labilithrix sp.]
MPPAAYRIETPRLVIRCWSPEDAERVKAAEDASREHLRPYMLWANREPEPLLDVIDKLRMFRSWFDKGDDFMFGAFERRADGSEGACVGGTGLHPRAGSGGMEVGYWVHADHLRRGIATEMAAALTRVGFEVHRLRWVEIRCAASNAASAGIPRALGFAHEAVLRDRLVVSSGAIEDALVFTLLAKDHEASPARRMPVKAFDGGGRALLG